MQYTGRQTQISLSSWIFFTVCAGLLPSILKFLFLLLSRSKISSDSFHTELFFFSLVLLIEVLKNTPKKTIRWRMSVILVVIYSSAYGYFLSGDLKLLKDEYIASSDTILVCALFSIAVGCILGLITILTGGEQL